jgi:hypothetical protein
MADKRFFTNTYITGSGRQNYLRIDKLEDPLFTSFTFDIDYTTSPLFYTINNSYFNSANANGLAGLIEKSLKEMYNTYMGEDQGYDILPVLSGIMIDDTKLGFGLQQNVYMDLPLYGATEYIYMVDKRNGGADQNDVRFNNTNNQQTYNQKDDKYEYSNKNDSYKLGDAVKSVVNDSDKAWAERQQQQNQNQIAECNAILDDEKVINEHRINESSLNTALRECEDIKTNIGDKEYTESDLINEINKLKGKANEFNSLKLNIVNWVNSELLNYQNKVINIYNKNECVREILTYDDISMDGKSDQYDKKLKKQFGENYENEFIIGGSNSFYNEILQLYNTVVGDINGETLLVKDKNDEYSFIVNKKLIIEKFKDKLSYFGLGNFTGEIRAHLVKTHPEWLDKIGNLFYISTFGDFKNYLYTLMEVQCELDDAFSEDFTTDEVKNIEIYEDKLEDIRTRLYGWDSTSQTACNEYNPEPDSPYGQYLAAKEKLENDDYSQAYKSKTLAESGNSEISSMLSDYDSIDKSNSQNNSVLPEADPGAVQLDIDEKKTNYAPQTVFDMIGFISGMKKMTEEYPYIIQSITGLDTAYNKHYVVKDPYLGSGDDKITLTCLESLDLRVSSMFNRYFNAVYDRQYRRERVPVNLRRFNCSVYVHDVRNFVSKMRQIDNRILELTDMYYSVIEFKFYDCEIVPEETGNIFNDISNEAPSEMKKTNFTFTYGNCVVNFIPNKRIASY